jgi:glutaconate CoA-transferase subunit A
VHGSDLAALNKWASITDPYGSGKDVWVIPAIQPDIAVIHVNEVNELGDARIYGTFNWDRIMTRAAKKVFVVAEKMESIESFQERPELTMIPSFMTKAVAVVPNGAWPGSCWPLYEVDYPEVESYMNTEGSLEEHMARAPEAKEAAHA